MNGKKVIFVGGTSYSGSTFFDMILGNDPRGFSCGEVSGLFYPHLPHHFNPVCGCGSVNCQLWEKVRENGIGNIYKTIFEQIEDLDFIVDSGKNPFWIDRQSKYIRKQGMNIKNILIWKNPYEFAYSYKKRGLANWEREWITYHRLYFRLIKQWKAVSYRVLVHDHGILQDICGYLGITYFPDKHEYWNKRHHILFGNNSAKIHLYTRDDENFKRIVKNVENKNKLKIDQAYRKIAYQKLEDKNLVRDVQKKIEERPVIQEIWDYLETVSIPGQFQDVPRNKNISMSYINTSLRELKYRARLMQRKIKGFLHTIY